MLPGMSTPTVVVTGASTGIGRAIVELLADRDVRVVAAVRDLSTVVDHPLVHGVRLDVTDLEEARSAAKVVDELVGSEGLHGLVNNAGIAVGGPLEFVDVDDVRRQLEVNVVAQVGVTQAFLPLLRRRGKGARLVFTSSIGGRVAGPFIGPYSASKFALNGLAEAWRRELLPWGIEVSTLAPATVATPIWDKATSEIDAIVDTLPAEAHELYGTAIAGMRRMIEGADGVGIPASKVAEAAHHALFSRRPRTEYLPGTEAKVAALASTVLPTRTFDRVIHRRYED